MRQRQTKIHGVLQALPSITKKSTENGVVTGQETAGETTERQTVRRLDVSWTSYNVRSNVTMATGEKKRTADESLNTN